MVLRTMGGFKVQGSRVCVPVSVCVLNYCIVTFVIISMNNACIYSSNTIAHPLPWECLLLTLRQ